MAKISLLKRIKAPITRFWWHVRGISVTIAAICTALLALKATTDIAFLSTPWVDALIDGGLVGSTIIGVIAQSTYDPSRVQPFPEDKNVKPNDQPNV